MKKKITITIIFLILLISYLYLGNKLNVYINCPIKEITGLYCPGCGITRMLQAILQLNFYQAFRYNPLLFISLPFFIFFTIEGIITKKDPLYNKIPNKILITIIIIFIIYGMLRNLPLFDFLAPTIVR
ncbi:MAG: DUF2752 domain-containing protein [Candidatus Faecimonas sp.]|nr:DUF2752 domain-containing protein [Candidatus Faecimonas sp.]